MNSRFKTLPRISIKAVGIITAIEIFIGIMAGILSLGDATEANHVYPIDVYMRISAFPLGYLLPEVHSLLITIIDLILWAITIERIIALSKKITAPKL